MPRFRVRLEDPNSDEFRVIVIHSDDEAAARVAIERRERKFAEFELDPDGLADAKRLVKNGGVVDGKHDRRGLADAKAHLGIHGQAEPYKIVSLEEWPKPRKDREAKK
jgi:hypothetical protein